MTAMQTANLIISLYAPVSLCVMMPSECPFTFSRLVDHYISLYMVRCI
jgi:hypothetical protein